MASANGLGGTFTQVQSTATLLSLPNEFLNETAWSVAPLGGTKAGNLRLVSCRLASVAAAVTWSSLRFGPHLEELDELLDELLVESSTLRGQHQLPPLPPSPSPPVVLRLRSRAQLPQTPTPPRPRSDYNTPPLPFLGSRPRPQRTSVFLSLLPPSTRLRPLRDVRRGGRVLVLDTTLGPHRLYQQQGCFFPWRRRGSQLLSAVIEPADPPSSLIPTTKDALVAILSLGLTSRPRCERLVIRFHRIGIDRRTERLLNLLTARSQHLEIGGIHFRGLPLLFHEQPAAESTFFVTLLSHLGPRLRALTLPVGGTFVLDWAFDVLSMPTTERLILSTDELSTSTPANLLSATTHPHLLRLISPTKFPRLLSLHLRGWLDFSDLPAIGHATLDELEWDHVVLFDLLEDSRDSGVLELRLENSEGRGLSEDQFFFSRATKEEDWVARVVRVW